MVNPPFSDPISIADVSALTGVPPTEICQQILQQPTSVAVCFSQQAVLWDSTREWRYFPNPLGDLEKTVNEEAWVELREIVLEDTPNFLIVRGHGANIEPDFCGWILADKSTVDQLVESGTAPLNNFSAFRSGPFKAGVERKRGTGVELSNDISELLGIVLEDRHFWGKQLEATFENSYVPRRTVLAVGRTQGWDLSGFPLPSGDTLTPSEAASIYAIPTGDLSNARRPPNASTATSAEVAAMLAAFPSAAADPTADARAKIRQSASDAADLAPLLGKAREERLLVLLAAAAKLVADYERKSAREPSFSLKNKTPNWGALAMAIKLQCGERPGCGEGSIANDLGKGWKLLTTKK